MTWPFENDTSFIEKKIASRSFLRDRMRNLFVVTAIILTTVLFTGLFTLGAGITASTQRANYILSGGDGHARIIDMNDSEYATISSHPLIREIAYCRKLADSVDNGQLSKRETLFWYYDDVGMKYQFIEPTVGHKPVAENEVIADTTTLELLGVPEKIGAELSLELTIHGQKVTRNFILSGWWNSYPGVQYGTIVTSRAYMDAHEDELVNTFSQDHNDTGTITGVIKFENTKNVERDLATVIADSGYSSDTEAPNYINAGVNPLYLSSEKSTGTGTILALICILAAFLLTGYLIIYNIFQISVLRDLHFYGLLKTIGTTDRQIRSILSRQAWILSLIGIPIGLGGGFFIGKALLPLLIEQTSFSAAYATVSPNPLIFVAAALFALLTVKISIRKPVKMAAKVSPIEALRYTDSDTAMKGKRKKRIRSDNLQKRMAWENLGRDKKRTILVILSLSLSIILTNTVFNFSNSVDPENAIQNMINFDFCIGQSSLLDYYRVSEESALSQSFIQAVEQQDGFDYGGCEYGCKSSYKSETTKQAYNQQEDGSFSTYLYGLDPLLLSCVQVVDGELNMEKLASGNYILEGAYVGTRGDLDKSSLNHSVGDQVQVSCNGIVRDFTVLAHVVANEANTYDWVGSCFFLPSEVYEDFTCNNYVMSYSFDVSQGKGPEMDAFLDEYTKNVEPTMTYKSKSTIMAGVTDIQNMVVSIGGTMAFIIGLIGILNFANTMLTSIFTRRREFATLQSVGMTGRQLLKMLRQEGCAYVLLATVVSVPLSLIGALQVIRPICKQIWFLNFKLEVWPMLVMPVLLLLFGLAIPYIAYRLISRQSVTERLKVGE